MQIFMRSFVFLWFSICALGGDHPSGHRQLGDASGNLKPHYEFLIIGSGYGGSVAGLRIAQALQKQNPGQVYGKTAILERGKEWMPGDFPENIFKLASVVRHTGNPLGLLNTHTHSNAQLESIGASALGGTSQLNAGISERPPVNVLMQPEFPDAIRKDLENGELEGDFARAEDMLMPNRKKEILSLPKSKAHLENFPEGFPVGQLNLNINREKGEKRFGIQQNACTNCGNCCGGCNVGAKNTLTVNYLPCAKDLGVDIFTQIEVDHFEILSDGSDSSHPPLYEVFYTYYSFDDLGVLLPRQGSVTTNTLILGAGSTGSTQLLLRSQSPRMPFSKVLGSRVSANADVLGFVYNSDVQTNVAADKNSKSLIENTTPVGQTITVYGDYREFNKDKPLEEQFLLLDGSIPRPLVKDVAQAMGLALGPQYWKSPTKLSRVARDLVSSYPPQNGAINHSMVLLACGHDSASGRYVLDENRNAYIEWPGILKEKSFQYITSQMETYAKRMGGKFIANPQTTFGGKLQATHPLGGAPMGETVEDGVVNHAGQVFHPAGGVYKGLYVVDAAIIPRSLGVPPLLTITALAERAMRHFIQDYFGSCGEKLRR